MMDQSDDVITSSSLNQDANPCKISRTEENEHSENDQAEEEEVPVVDKVKVQEAVDDEPASKDEADGPREKTVSIPEGLDDRQVEALRKLYALIEENDLVSKEEEDGIGNFRLGDGHNLLRYLSARRWDVDKALEMVRASVEWRNTVLPTLITEAQLPVLYDSGLYRLMGESLEGYQVVLAQVRYFDPEAITMQEFQKYVAFTMERALARMINGKERAIWIFDMEDWSMGKHASGKANDMVRELITIAQNHYPKRLQKLLVVNAPFMFFAVWKVISMWMDNETRNKIDFCDGKDLIQYIAPDDLHVRFGGLRQSDYPVHPVDSDSR